MTIVQELRSEADRDDHRGAGAICRRAADEIWCLREIVRDVRIMANAGNFAKHEGEPWLRRVMNIDLES